MDKIKILIVEDETIVALDIKHALRRLNFEVTGMATNYDDALKSARANIPHILLTDIQLENSRNGIEIAKEIQKIAPISIIYLTAYSDDSTIQEAIQTDPIGYMLKPFNRDELKSTIFLAIHKMNKVNELTGMDHHKLLGFGFHFEEKNKTLFFDNQVVKLSYKERELLSILIEANGQIVSFKTIENLLWATEPVANSTLRTLLYRLRTKLDYKLIDTIPAVGCRLIIEKL